jgi:hypothetical protein
MEELMDSGSNVWRCQSDDKQTYRWDGGTYGWRYRWMRARMDGRTWG